MKKTIPLVAVFLGSVVICAVGARSHSASASVLWGVMEDPTTIEEFLVDIDPTTGVGTPIGSSFNIPSPASQTSAFDPSTGTLFFVSTFDAESEERLFSVDTATGSLISTPFTQFGSLDALSTDFLEFDLATGVSVPEPSTLTLFATGLAGLGFVGWRRRAV